jgi:hypothetical protein
MTTLARLDRVADFTADPPRRKGEGNGTVVGAMVV